MKVYFRVQYPWDNSITSYGPINIEKFFYSILQDHILSLILASGVIDPATLPTCVVCVESLLMEHLFFGREGLKGKRMEPSFWKLVIKSSVDLSMARYSAQALERRRYDLNRKVSLTWSTT